MTIASPTDLATSFEQQQNQKNGNASTTQPTPMMLYQTGFILYNTQKQLRNANKEKKKQYHTFLQSYRDMITSLSPLYIKNIICNELNVAFCSVVKGNNDVALFPAMKSMCGIYTNSSLLCQIGFDSNVCLAIISFYDDYFIKKKQEDEEMKECLFQTLSCFLLHGLIYAQHSQREEEDDNGLHAVMEVIQTLTIGDSNYCIGDLIQWQTIYKEHHHDDVDTKITTLQKAVKHVFVDPTDQREYLLLMLDSCPNSLTANAILTQSSSSTITTKKKKNQGKKQNKTAKDTARSTLQLRINQIRDVLPDLGEGFVEIALAIYDHDVNRTLTSLMDPNALHPRLRALDPTLPARKKDDEIKEAEEMEARRIQKAHLKEMEGQMEQQSYMLEQTALAFGGGDDEEAGAGVDEYNDDYDDQYDGQEQDGGDIGNADGGMYDVDLDAIRAYNKATLEAEREASFWDENRNTNRLSGKGPPKQNKKKSEKKGDNDNDDDDSEGNGNEKKYRGPDKGRGGRVIGPDGKYLPLKKGGKKGKAQQQKQQQQPNGEGGDGGSGGGKTNQPNKGKKGGGGGGAKQPSSGGAAADDNLTKIQKRRKNDNKAKIGNHHRKDRALKKTGGPGGM
uniref:CUE domain-containing protein n=1 Tax=Ditylum brightwellii TaxID=49249 RepID=A0A7S2EMS8_9STRA|mmetsp:Transcript_35353/g.52768  ORF Transcript_35353/g.52768 Transcript_35353/m.52768 type:complete len:619 (+) Transcript_35353:161-2017(+)